MIGAKSDDCEKNKRIQFECVALTYYKMHLLLILHFQNKTAFEWNT